MQTQIGLPAGKNAGARLDFSQKLQRLWRDVKKNKAMYGLMAPYMILFTLFTVLPVITSMFLSFTYYNIIEPPRFIGWENYKILLLEDDVFLISVKNTLMFAFITGPLSYFGALLLAWFINELKPKVRAVATLLFYAPSISANVFFIWTYIFQADSYGFVNSSLMRLGIIKEPIAWLQKPEYNLYIIMLVALWMSLGTGFLAFIAGFQNIDKTLYEAGAIDGIKNRWQELYLITLPSMAPQLVFAAVLQIAASFAVSDVAAQLAGFPSPLYSAHTIVLHMVDYGNIRYEMGYASAIAVVLFSITVAFGQFARRVIKAD